MTYDFVIIGSGPAGSTLSWKLSNLGFKIAMIDRAIYEEKRLINDFFCPYIHKSPKFYTPVYSDQLGGNSALWHSKIYLISEKEYDHTKWGFDYNELKFYSTDLAKKLKIEDVKLTEILTKDENYYHTSIRSNLKNLFKYFKLDINNNIEIYKGYSPTKLNFQNKKVESVEILNTKNQKKTLFVKKSLIFCAGGLGNPHLLMNLIPIKNEIVGKNLSDHAHVNLCRVNSNKLENYKNILKPNIKNNLTIFNLDKNEELAQIFEEENFFAGVQLDYKIDPMRKIRRLFLKINNIYIRKILSIFGFLILKLNGLVAKFGIFFNKYYKYSFEFFFSQNQDPRNFLKLDQYKVDEFGLKKININWDLTKKDKDKINSIIQKSVGFNGKLFQSSEDISFSKNFYSHGLAGLHPSCTTKIGINKSQGVVDSNLKLYDYENIFVSGSSVFPQNGFTNPTWTIMTLSSRLASFLKDKN
mgnify:CR=1 FL=1